MSTSLTFPKLPFLPSDPFLEIYQQEQAKKEQEELNHFLSKWKSELEKGTTEARLKVLLKAKGVSARLQELVLPLCFPNHEVISFTFEQELIKEVNILWWAAAHQQFELVIFLCMNVGKEHLGH